MKYLNNLQINNLKEKLGDKYKKFKLVAINSFFHVITFINTSVGFG